MVALSGNNKSFFIDVKNDTTRMIRDIGRGGFSTVHLVEDSITQHQYALKRITVGDIINKTRALNEVKYLNLLKDSPYFLQIYDHEIKPLGNGRDDIYLLLEYCPNGNLANYLQNKLNQVRDPDVDDVNGRKFIREELIMKLFFDICKGIKALHQQSPPLAHRDIKPQNILVKMDKNGIESAILIDFGSINLARVSTNHDFQTKSYLQQDCLETSTPSYRPPELLHLGGILEDNEVDERSDIWSLGCVLFYMAYQVNPFDLHVMRGGSLSLAIQGGSESVKFPHLGYSSKFRSLVLSMLQVESRKRPTIFDILDNVK
eukprot:TRINITY_DN7344_c0_g1_i2.p1 TRINITY_DN7344_c0_g1~~TRINITY_DN7344_c0_g1_i2.p1  ORF type:complete len:317 (-),score=52.37 TRINITY_DN7344_c0_g1_i2:15-965(-)